MKALKPGARMAGGLGGMIVGGGLGGAIAAQARRENPAADILGKVVAGGDLSNYRQLWHLKRWHLIITKEPDNAVR